MDEQRNFQRVFIKKFVPSIVKFFTDNDLPRKSVLLLDNASLHPDTEELQDEEIKAMFLLPNVTAIHQLMRPFWEH